MTRAMSPNGARGRAELRLCGLAIAVLALVALLSTPVPGSAQSLTDLSGALGGAKSGGLGVLGGKAPRVDQARTGSATQIKS